MKKRNYFLACMALSLGLVGCNKDDSTVDPVTVPEGETMSVSIKIEESALTRAATTPAAEAKAVFNGGYLYFVNSGGQVTEYFTISNGGTTDLTIGNVDIADLEDTFTFPEINTTSTHVHVFGNVPYASLPGNGNISAIGSLMANLKSQTDAVGGVSNVSLYGSDVIIKPVGQVNAYVQVELAPIASRVELSRITGTGDVENFKVSGIFINYFYEQGQLNGVARTQDYTMYTSLDAFYQNTGNLYNAANQGIIFDYNAAGVAPVNSKVCTPVAPNTVWAYNLFAGDPFHIVIRLDDVEISGSNVGTKYLTVRKFKHAGKVTYLTEMKGGEIYTIANLSFDEDDLTDLPEPEDTIEVDVTVKIMKWTRVPLDYEYATY